MLCTLDCRYKMFYHSPNLLKQSLQKFVCKSIKTFIVKVCIVFSILKCSSLVVICQFLTIFLINMISCAIKVVSPFMSQNPFLAMLRTAADCKKIVNTTTQKSCLFCSINSGIAGKTCWIFATWQTACKVMSQVYLLDHFHIFEVHLLLHSCDYLIANSKPCLSFPNRLFASSDHCKFFYVLF